MIIIYDKYIWPCENALCPNSTDRMKVQNDDSVPAISSYYIIVGYFQKSERQQLKFMLHTRRIVE